MALDRYGNLYWAGPGGTGGKTWKFFITGSLAAGFLSPKPCGDPSEEELKKFLTGHSINIGGGYWGGGGITIVPGVGKAIQIGFVTPQVGVSYHYSEQKGKIGLKW